MRLTEKQLLDLQDLSYYFTDLGMVPRGFARGRGDVILENGILKSRSQIVLGYYKENIGYGKEYSTIKAKYTFIINFLALLGCEFQAYNGTPTQIRRLPVINGSRFDNNGKKIPYTYNAILLIAIKNRN